MSRANDRAFPATCEEPYTAADGVVVGTHEVTHGGLTIREHYAGLAMQGMLSNPTFDNLEACVMDKRAVAWADALIAELAKAQP